MKTAIVTSDSSEKHLTGDGHPEQPKRVESITNILKQKKDLIWEKPDVVPEKILTITHTEDYIKNLKNSFPKKGINFLDGDTVVSPGSKEAVFDAAGSTIKAIDGIEKKNLKMLFVLLDLLDITLKKIKLWAFVVYQMLVLQQTI